MTKDVQLKRKTSLKTLLSLVLSTIMIIILGITPSSLKADTAKTSDGIQTEIEAKKEAIGKTTQAEVNDKDNYQAAVPATGKEKDIEDAEKAITAYIQRIKDNEAAVTKQKTALTTVKDRVNDRIPSTDENNKTKEDVKNTVELLLADKKQEKSAKDTEVANAETKLTTLKSELAAIKTKYQADKNNSQLTTDYNNKQNEIKNTTGDGQEKTVNDLKAAQTKLQQEQDIIKTVSDAINRLASDAKAKAAKDLIQQYIDELGIQEEAIKVKVAAFEETTKGLEVKKQALLTALATHTYDVNHANVKTARNDYDNKIKDIKNELDQKKELYTVVNGLKTALTSKTDLNAKKAEITKITNDKNAIKTQLNTLNNTIKNKATKEEINNYLQDQLNEATDKITQIEHLTAEINKVGNETGDDKVSTNVQAKKDTLTHQKDNVITKEYDAINDAKTKLTATTVTDLEKFVYELKTLYNSYNTTKTTKTKALEDATTALTEAESAYNQASDAEKAAKLIIKNTKEKDKKEAQTLKDIAELQFNIINNLKTECEKKENTTLKLKKACVTNTWNTYNWKKEITVTVQSNVNVSGITTVEQITNKIAEYKDPLQVKKDIIDTDNKILTTNTKLKDVCNNATDVATAKASVQQLYDVANAVDQILSGTTDDNQVKKIVDGLTNGNDDEKIINLNNKLTKLVKKLEIQKDNALDLEKDPKTYTTTVNTLIQVKKEKAQLENEKEKLGKEQQELNEKLKAEQKTKEAQKLDLTAFINDIITLSTDNVKTTTGTDSNKVNELQKQLLTKYSGYQAKVNDQQTEVPSCPTANDVFAVLQGKIHESLNDQNLDVVVENYNRDSNKKITGTKTAPQVTIKPKKQADNTHLFKTVDGTKEIVLNMTNDLSQLKTSIDKLKNYTGEKTAKVNAIIEAINNEHKGLGLKAADVEVVILSETDDKETVSTTDKKHITHTVTAQITPKLQSTKPQYKLTGSQKINLTYQVEKPAQEEKIPGPKTLEEKIKQEKHQQELAKIEVEIQKQKAEVAKLEAETQALKPTQTKDHISEQLLAQLQEQVTNMEKKLEEQKDNSSNKQQFTSLQKDLQGIQATLQQQKGDDKKSQPAQPGDQNKKEDKKSDKAQDGTNNSSVDTTNQTPQPTTTTNEPADESWTWTTWTLIIVAVVGVIGTIGYIVKNKQE